MVKFMDLLFIFTIIPRVSGEMVCTSKIYIYHRSIEKLEPEKPY